VSEVVARFSQLRRELEQSIRDAVEAVAIRQVDPELMSCFLFGAWNGVAALALRRDGAPPPSRCCTGGPLRAEYGRLPESGGSRYARWPAAARGQTNGG
jgi:hypothetical protein